ncbi:MAG: CPXCG motif-containing cysteine-rich protein [Myxococcota bacterium]
MKPGVECESTCPYCFEKVEVWVDASAGSSQRYVEDCPVCCRPWMVWVSCELDPYSDEEAAVVPHVMLLHQDA